MKIREEDLRRELADFMKIGIRNVIFHEIWLVER